MESAEPDLKNSVVSVKGVYDPEKLVEYVKKRTGKHAAIVKQEPEKEEKVEETKEAKKEEVEKEKKSGEGEENKEKKEEEAKGETKAEETAASSEDSNKVVPEVKINESFYNSPRYGMEVYAYPAHPVHPVHPAYPGYYHAYPPQMFSDENPNACIVM